MTPIWVLLVVAGLGVLGTVAAGLGAAWLTQRRSDARERIAWEREQQRERDRWAREDRLRTAEEQLSSYISFYKSLQAVSVALRNDLADPQVRGALAEALLRLRADLVPLDLLGSAEVAEAAYLAYLAADDARLLGRDAPDKLRAKLDELSGHEQQVIDTMRSGLSVPKIE